MLTPADHVAPAAAELFDTPVIAAELEGLAKLHAGHEQEIRKAEWVSRASLQLLPPSNRLTTISPLP